MPATLLAPQEPAVAMHQTAEHPLTVEDAKAMLASAQTAVEQKYAMAAAMEAGMPLYEIEEFLDWSDAVREHGATMEDFARGESFSEAMPPVTHPQPIELAFVLPNDQSQIMPVVEFLAAQSIRIAACDATEEMRITLALEEALVNALYHGNLEIDSDAEQSQRLSRHDLAQRRSSCAPFCRRRIRVVATIAPQGAVFVVRDEGRGFDPRQLPDPTNEANLGRCCGRGVFLMRSLMDDVTFNEIGNEVTMVRRWAK
jgi:anti-sigma regulatory factor (Ser/Thr protein kinase)